MSPTFSSSNANNKPSRNRRTLGTIAGNTSPAHQLNNMMMKTSNGFGVRGAKLMMGHH